MPFMGYYTPAELAALLGGGESTYRIRAQYGEFIHASKQGGTWFIPLRDLDKRGRGYDTEFAKPAKLYPKPSDTADIVLAQNDDGRFGVYLEDDWYSAEAALVMLEYLQKHKEWLVEKAQANERAQDV